MSNPTSDVVREAQSTETYDASAKQKAGAKLSRIPVKVVQGEILKKPSWIRVRAGSPTTRFYEIKDILRKNKLVTVCEEASCPNIGECFGKGTATSEPGKHHRGAQTPVRGNYQRRPRRPARRR